VRAVRALDADPALSTAAAVAHTAALAVFEAFEGGARAAELKTAAASESTPLEPDVTPDLPRGPSLSPLASTQALAALRFRSDYDAEIRGFESEVGPAGGGDGITWALRAAVLWRFGHALSVLRAAAAVAAAAAALEARNQSHDRELAAAAAAAETLAAAPGAAVAVEESWGGGAASELLGAAAAPPRQRPPVSADSAGAAAARTLSDAGASGSNDIATSRSVASEEGASKGRETPADASILEGAAAFAHQFGNTASPAAAFPASALAVPVGSAPGMGTEIASSVARTGDQPPSASGAPAVPVLLAKYRKFLANRAAEREPGTRWCPTPGCETAILRSCRLRSSATGSAALVAAAATSASSCSSSSSSSSFLYPFSSSSTSSSSSSSMSSSRRRSLGSLLGRSAAAVGASAAFCLRVGRCTLACLCGALAAAGGCSRGEGGESGDGGCGSWLGCELEVCGLSTGRPLVCPTCDAHVCARCGKPYHGLLGLKCEQVSEKGGAKRVPLNGCPFARCCRERFACS